MRTRTYVAMNVYWLGLAFLWNGLHPILLPALLLDFVPESLKNTYLGAMTFAGLILAMIIQPIAGAMSDHTRSRWGRRRPWILAGTLFAVTFLAAMALATGFWGLLAAYLLLQIASNTAHGPAQGLIPDLVPTERRGLASGVKNLFDMGGLVIASLWMGQLAGDGDFGLSFAVSGGVLAVSALITILATPEPAAPAGEATASYSLRDLVRTDLGKHPDYGWFIVSRFLVLLGIYAVQGFAQYYVQDWLQVPNAAQVTGNLLATIGLALTLLVFPAGLLSDRWGRKRLHVFSGGLATAGILALIFVQDVSSLYIFGGIIGIATGTYVSVNWALATDLIPQEEAGKYLGLSNLATAGAGAVGRLAGPLVDGVNALWPERFLGYPALFLLAAASTLLGTILVLRIRRR